jgi:hypothetical protein
MWFDERWCGLDPRGEKPSTAGPFDPDCEWLAYSVDAGRGERDYRDVFAERLPCVPAALHRSCTVGELDRSCPRPRLKQAASPRAGAGRIGKTISPCRGLRRSSEWEQEPPIAPFVTAYFGFKPKMTHVNAVEMMSLFPAAQSRSKDWPDNSFAFALSMYPLICDPRARISVRQVWLEQLAEMPGQLKIDDFAGRRLRL